MKIYTFAFALMSTTTAIPAQAQQEDEQIWTQINTNIPLSDRASITLEQIARFSDRQSGLYQTEFGGLVGLRIAKWMELGAGYRRVGSHNGNRAADENRLRQQLVVRFGAITGRLRIDERMNPDGNEIGFRIRPLVRYNHRLGRAWLIAFASHESFFLPNSTRWGQNSGYERMRNMAGLTTKIGSDMSLDIGYLNQLRLSQGGSRPKMDHALSLQLTVNLHRLSFHSGHD